MGIQIKYTGSAGVRTIEQYKWSSENDFVQAVDVQTAAGLIAYPRPGQFALVAGQKLSPAEKKELEELLGVAVKVPTVPEVEVVPPSLLDVPGLSAERRANLKDAGVPDLETLAGLDEAAVKEAASKTGATRKEISGWVEQAKSLLEKAKAQA